jgi:hypothetical protein
MIIIIITIHYYYYYCYYYYYIYWYNVGKAIIIYWYTVMLVKQSFTTHIWWYIPSIYGDLGDGLLLFYILPTLLAFLKRYWRILYASVRSIICFCIYWYTAMAFNTVLHIDIIAYSIIRLWRIFSQYDCFKCDKANNKSSASEDDRQWKR